MGERRTIVIAGAGIGGLAASLALANAGFDVVIVERTAELTEIGAGIQLSPNAGRILATLGLDDAIAAAAAPVAAIDVRNGMTGEAITSLPLAAIESRYGFPYRVIHRADLQAVLVRAVEREPNVRLILGATVTDVLTKGASLFVKIRRAGGSDVIPAAALIGADGVWSSTRARIEGAKPARTVGRTAWRAVIALDNAPPSMPTDRLGLWLGPNAHLVHYPIGQGAAINIVAIVEEPWSKAGWSAPGDRIRLAERFSGWTTGVREIINAPFGWQKWAICAVDPSGPWVSDRIALLGDAAHAMPPFLAQGAAMAIEDGSALAGALAATEDVATALKSYEAGRKPRVTQMWKEAWRTGEVYHYGHRRGRLRDFALRLFGPRLIFRQNDWIYRWPGK